MTVASRLRAIALGLIIGTTAFWMGFAKLVVMSSRLTLHVMRGGQPQNVISQLHDQSGKRA